MNLLDWFSSQVSRKHAQPVKAVYLSEAADPKRSPSDYRGFAEEAYRKNVVAYRCINILAENAASVPWLLFKKSANGKRTDVVEHPILKLLRKPNPRYSGTTFQEQYFGFYLLAGNNYTQAIGPRPTEPPLQLFNLRPDQMQVMPGQGGVPASYIYRPNSTAYTYPVDKLGRSSIRQFKKWNPLSEWYGLSAIEASALSIDTHNAAAIWNLKLVQNSAKPSLLITVDGNLTPDQFERLKEDIARSYEGPWKAGKPMLMAKGIDAKPVSWSPLEMDFFNSKKTSSSDVALAFGVPGQMVGVEGSQTFANYEQARLGLYEDTVLPLKRRQVEEFNDWLLPAYGAEGASLELGSDEENLEALEPRRAERWKRAQESDFLSADEKRELTGYSVYEPSEKAGSKIMVSTSMVPLDAAAEPLPDEPVGDAEDVGGTDVVDDNDELEDPPADDGKGFNLVTATARARYWHSQDRRKLAMARAIAPKVARVFAGEKNRVMKALKGVQDVSLAELAVDRELEATKPTMKAILAAGLTEVGRIFGEEVIEQAKKAASEIVHMRNALMLLGPELKGPKERFAFSLSKFVESRVNEDVEKISQTTKRRLMKRIKESLSERDDDGHAVEVSLPKAVKGSYDSWSESRSLGISRTEVHITSETAKREAADSLQIPGLQKEWVSVKDDRVRDSHAKVDGERVPIHEKFEVEYESGVELMDGPGDQSASPGNVINCRCSLVFTTKT